MKRLTILAILILCAAAFAVPQYLTYQGILKDNTGALVTGSKTMSFKVFPAVSGGVADWSSGDLTVSVTNGNYTVQLGTISSTIFNGNDKWLEVAVDGTALSPRLKINSVAYAIKAEVADSATTVGDLAITTGKIANSAVTVDKLAGGITGDKINSTTNITTSGIIQAGELKVTKISTVGAGCVGKWSILNGSSISTPIVNPNIGDNSLIFITPLTEAVGLTYEALVPININTPVSGQFNVRTSNRQVVPQEIFFNYLIIN